MPRVVRYLLYALGAAVAFFALFLLTLWTVQFLESTEFCSTCHDVMEPEITTHQISPHAFVDCGICHAGPGTWGKIQAHLAAARYAYVYPLNLYERPLESPRSTVRPARETCEQCHWPQNFVRPKLVVLNEYAQDEENSLTQVQLLMKVGGGGVNPLGGDPGIHWHIENPVYFIALGDQRQEIPWVRATFQGEERVYIATDAELTPEQIEEAEKLEMDCLDCHNRATHIVRNPSEALDEALDTGMIPADLPFIKELGVEVLRPEYESREEGLAAVRQVADVYRAQYPEIYQERQVDVERAVEGLELLYSWTQFPFMNVYWDTYANHIGHTEFPGCFRCHDGKHLSSDYQVIRLECNICHNIPLVARSGEPLPPIDINTQEEPESHHSTLWLAEHRFQFDATCVECHTVGNPGGADDSSFCANSACHGREWVYADLNAPEVRELSQPPRVPAPVGVAAPIPHPSGPDVDCLLCHDLDAVIPFPENHADFTQEICAGCHESTIELGDGEATPGPTAPAPSPTPTAGTETAEPEEGPSPTPTQTGRAEEATPTPPADTGTPEPTPAGIPGANPVPHELAGREECFVCHDPNGNIVPAPQDHEGRSVLICVACHPAQEE